MTNCIRDASRPIARRHDGLVVARLRNMLGLTRLAMQTQPSSPGRTLLAPRIVAFALVLCGFASGCWPRARTPADCAIEYRPGASPILDANQECSAVHRSWEHWDNIWSAMDEPKLWGDEGDKLVFRVGRHDVDLGIATVFRAELRDGKGFVEVKRLRKLSDEPEVRQLSRRELDDGEVGVITECIAGRKNWRFASEFIPGERHGVDWIVEANDRGDYAVDVWSGGSRFIFEPEPLESCFNDLVRIGSFWW